MELNIPNIKKRIEDKNKSLISELMDTQKCNDLFNFVRIQQSLIANKRLATMLDESQKEE